LTDANRLHERTGFEVVAQKPHHGFGHRLTDQDPRPVL
jgi:hypothetical protein